MIAFKLKKSKGIKRAVDQLKAGKVDCIDTKMLEELSKIKPKKKEVSDNVFPGISFKF